MLISLKKKLLEKGQNLKGRLSQLLKNYQNLKAHLLEITLSLIITSLFIFSFVAFNLKSDDSNENFWNILWNFFNTDFYKFQLLSIAIPVASFFWRERRIRLEKIEKEKIEKEKIERQVKEEEERTKREEKIERQVKEEEERTKRLEKIQIEKEKIEKEKEKIEKENKERLAKIIEEHKVRRIEAIEHTFDQWNQINNLISEVRFVKLNETNIRDVQFKIASQSIALGKVIYLWSSRFPILPNIAYDLFASYINVLYWSAWGIAYSLRKTVDTLFQEDISQERDYKIEINEKCRGLQEALGIFQRGIVRISFIHLSYVLKFSDKLLEYIETYFEDEQMQSEFIDLLRIKIEKIFNKILEKEQVLEKEQGSINKYREDYIKYIYYYPNESNKSQEFVPVPISLCWNIFKKRMKHDESFIKNILDEMGNTTDSTKKEIISGLNTKISNKTKKEMEKNIDNLINELLYLKLYEFLLFIDKFRGGKINYTSKILSNTENEDSSKNDELKLRISYKNIDIKIRQKIKIPELFVSQNDKDKIYDIIDDDIKGDSKPEYKNFMDLFKTQITDTNLMNIVADDVVEYIRFVGREIRFSNLLTPEDYLAPVS